ncbi:unnamed protein product [Schistosoma mattheei]|uniref:Uncharacterized protein n=1 Tax=Schistosoma mattheei TaxID=31246 RepID=A0A183PHD4_9TREM|nr:unnamed protein product [Schistosoma mattheei]
MESHKTDHIPELSPHYSETHSDDQLGGNTYRMDPLLELELAKMLNIPAIKGTDPYNLRRLSREMHICELTLTQMNYVSDLNSTRTTECMFLKLPLHLQREWVKAACGILKTGREPSFKDLCEFVKEQSDIANTRYGLLVNRGSNSGNKNVGVLKGKISTDYNAARISYESASDDNALLRSSSCLECSSNHSLDQCQKFKDKNLRERKKFVLRHSCLCTEKSVERVQKQAAFAIVPVLVRNGEKVAQTCAFLDSGSDASLITEDLAKRLNLEGEPKTISLKTSDKHSTIQCKEVQLEVSSLDSSSSFRIPNVWTVERLPMLRRTVPTTSQMKSWTYLKDISFPRAEDDNIKLLIECNAPSVHELKEIRTGKPNELFAVKTPLGWTLFGYYRGPCKSNHALNHLSAKEELKDKFEQLYSTEFKDPFSRTTSMSVEDRIALRAISNSVQSSRSTYCPQRELFPTIQSPHPSNSCHNFMGPGLLMQDRLHFYAIAQKHGFIVGQSYGRISAYFRNRYGETETKTKAAYLQLGVRVPSKDHVSEIVGKGGQKIKLIREETGALITTPGEQEEHVFIIETPPEIAMRVAHHLATRAREITPSKIVAGERRRGSTSSQPCGTDSGVNMTVSNGNSGPNLTPGGSNNFVIPNTCPASGLLSLSNSVNNSPLHPSTTVNAHFNGVIHSSNSSVRSSNATIFTPSFSSLPASPGNSNSLGSQLQTNTITSTGMFSSTSTPGSRVLLARG